MALDLQRILEAAAQAALPDSDSGQGSQRSNRSRSGRRSRRRLTGGRAFLIGAGAVTAGRLVVAVRRGELLDGIQRRLLEYEHRHFGEEPDEQEDEDYDAPEDEDEEDDEVPEASSASS